MVKFRASATEVKPVEKGTYSLGLSPRAFTLKTVFFLTQIVAAAMSI